MKGSVYSEGMLRAFFILQALDVTKVNRSVHQHEHESASVEKAAACNCLTEIGKLWEQLSSNKLDIESVQQQLKNIEKPSGELHGKSFSKCL